MSALSRYTQKLFGTTAGANQLGKYGSWLASPPGNLYSGSTINPSIVQALSNFQEGLYASTGGAYSPLIQDQNSLFYLAFYQLSYLLQSGIPEWDSETTYFTNNFVRVGAVVYVSLIDNNTNNSPNSSPSDWSNFSPSSPVTPTIQIFTGGTGTYTLPTSPRSPLYIRVKMCGGGGGGGSSSNSGTDYAAGTAGGSSTFGTSLLTANGGGGGLNESAAGGAGIQGGAGGTASFTAGSGIAISGQYGGCGVNLTGFGAIIGGPGGQNFFAGAGTVVKSTTNPFVAQNAISNTGGGGSGGSVDAGSSFAPGLGGGAGGYLDVILSSPNSTYSYAIGTGGAGGIVIGDNSPGGAGASGIIIVEEYYQ